jgi:hypothetical protein
MNCAIDVFSFSLMHLAMTVGRIKSGIAFVVISTANSLPLDHLTVAPTLIRFLFGRVTQSKSVSPSLIGRSPDSRSRSRRDSTLYQSMEWTRKTGDRALKRETTIGAENQGHNYSHYAAILGQSLLLLRICKA